MGLFLRNRQVAGNICFVVFLAMLFTVLPGQLFADKAFASPGPVEVDYATPNAAANSTAEMVPLDPVSNTDFANTFQAIADKIAGYGVNNLVYKLTYQSVYSQVYGAGYSVYLWVYNQVATGTTTSSELVNYKVYDGVYKTATVKVWSPPDNNGHRGGGGSSTVTPATPAVPGVTPATPASPASVVAKLATAKVTPVQAKQLQAINAALGKLIASVPSVSNRVVTVGKNNVFIPKLLVTSAKVVVVAPLVSTKLDPKAVNYKIGVVKAYLAAKGIKNVPVRYVFLNANPKLKVSVKPGSYFQVATAKTLLTSIKSKVATAAVVNNKAKILKAFGFVK